MELWIRSQNKQNLMKANDIVVKYNKILVFKDDDASTEVGEYKTKERALEVLDEIQHKLITLCDSMNRKLYVYEMPKE